MNAVCTFEFESDSQFLEKKIKPGLAIATHACSTKKIGSERKYQHDEEPAEKSQLCLCKTRSENMSRPGTEICM